MLDGAPVTTFESDKVRGLLAYLAVEDGRPHRREALAALLWPDTTQHKARQNLRRALYSLRQTLETEESGNPHLLVTRQSIQINPASERWLDVATFSALLKASQEHSHRQLDACASCATLLGEAIDLYRGDFLAGLSLTDSESFEEWRLFKQETLHEQAMEALTQLAAYHERRRDYGRAAGYLRWQIELEPWREAAHRQLMRVLALNGQRGAALRQYRTCRDILAAELAVESAPETQALYKRIEAGSLDLALIEAQNPYKGLQAFTEADAPVFFGREVFVERLVGAVHRQPVTVVVGPSGSGKSSILQAGLLSHLRAHPVSNGPESDTSQAKATERVAPGGGQVANGRRVQETWIALSFRPGDRPLYRLAEILMPLTEPDLAREQAPLEARIKTVADRLQRGEMPLEELVSSLLRSAEQQSPGRYRLLLVVDQFEEIYTDCRQADSRQAFVDCLLQNERLEQEAPSPPFSLVISLRADFAAEALSFRPLSEAIQAGGLVLGPMNANELRRAAEEPARSRGVVFEPGLLERLLYDAGKEPGNLPLLQFTLTLLWDQQLGGQLAHAAYEGIGRLDGALTCYADSVYEGLGPEDREGARRVFTQLVRLGEATQDTRRLATRAELQDQWDLVQKLADARLVVTDRDAADLETVELVHEALIHHWGLLRSWIEADRAFHTWHQGVRSLRRRWEASGHDEGTLLRGVPLAEGEEWARERGGQLPEPELAFIRASAALRDRARAEDAERRRRELAQARALAEAEHERAQAEARARRRVRWTAIGYALVLVIALGAVIWARLQLQATSQADAAARSLGLASQALLALDENDSGLALALAVEANRLPEPPAQARLVLAQAAYAPGTRRVLAGHAGPVQDVTVNGDGSRVLSVAADGTLIVWDMASGESLRSLATAPGGVQVVAAGPGGRRALTGADDGSLTVWDLELGQVQRRLAGHEAGVSALAASADGQTALSGAVDGSMIVWDLRSGEALHRLAGQDGPIQSVAISPDGVEALSIAAGSGPVVWNLPTGEAIHRLPSGGSNGEANLSGGGYRAAGGWAVAFGAEGTTAIALKGEQVLVWELDSEEQTGSRLYSELNLSSLAVSPDGRALLLGTQDGRLVFLDLTMGVGRQELLGHTGMVTAVEFTPDGNRALSASADGTVRLWDLYGTTAASEGGEIPTVADEGMVNAQSDGSRDPLLAWIEENRCLPELTCEQRIQYGVEPLCGETGTTASDGP
jgi:DNA-binding SARP family transcriptional activator